MSNIRKLLAKCSIETNNNANKKLLDYQTEEGRYGNTVTQALTAHHLSIYFLDTCMSYSEDFINCKKELHELHKANLLNMDNTFINGMYSDYLNSYLRQTFDCVEKLHVSDEL